MAAVTPSPGDAPRRHRSGRYAATCVHEWSSRSSRSSRASPGPTSRRRRGGRGRRDRGRLRPVRFDVPRRHRRDARRRRRRSPEPPSPTGPRTSRSRRPDVDGRRAIDRRTAPTGDPHSLIVAVQPVLDAVGATLVPPDRQERQRRTAGVGRAGRRRGAHAAAARRARPADRHRRGRARRPAAATCPARTSSAPSACSTSGARSCCAGRSRTSPTRWASAGSPSTTTSTPSTVMAAAPVAAHRRRGADRFDVIGLDADDTLWHSEDSFVDVEHRFVELVAPVRRRRRRRRRRAAGHRARRTCRSPATASRRSRCRWSVRR